MKDKTLEILGKYLDKDFRVSPMARSKSTIEEIKAIEKKLNVKFPEEYIHHLLAEDAEVLSERGIFVEVKEEIWRRPKQYDVGPFWTFLYGLHTFTTKSESEDWMQLEIAGKEFIESTGLNAVPILRIVGDADLYCVDESGKIMQYNHEEIALNEIGMDFWELLEKELKQLKERKQMMIDKNNK